MQKSAALIGQNFHSRAVVETDHNNASVGKELKLITWPLVATASICSAPESGGGAARRNDLQLKASLQSESKSVAFCQQNTNKNIIVVKYLPLGFAYKYSRQLEG